MKVTVTTTSTDLNSLLVTAGINMTEINTKRIKTNNNGYGIYLEVPAAGQDVFIENINAATVANGKAIAAEAAFAMDVRDIENFNLIVAGTTQDLIVLIT